MALGIERFTLTVRELLGGFFKASRGKDAPSLEIAFDDLRERVKKGDEQALRALIWLGFAVGKERDRATPDVEEALEAKARIFLDSFTISGQCSDVQKKFVRETLDAYLPQYKAAEGSVDKILDALNELEKDMQADRRVRQ